MFDNEIRERTKMSSNSRHYSELFSKLQSYLNLDQEPRSTSISEILHLVANQIHKRSMIVLFTDFFEPGRETMAGESSTSNN